MGLFSKFKDYNGELDDVLEGKTFSSNVKTLLLSMVYKLETSYRDFYTVKRCVRKREDFLNGFFDKTGLNFNIISQEQENELTVLGATRFVDEKVCVFVGGGGSTEISIFDKAVLESKNTSIGVMDIMNEFPDLADDFASTSLEDVMNYIEKRLNVPDNKADVLILAGGGHEVFARGSGIKYEKNTLYEDYSAPIMMDIETRKNETKRYYEAISLDDIKKRVSNPDWWFATRAMCAFVLVVAEKIGAKYIVPTNISMVYGLLEQ